MEVFKHVPVLLPDFWVIDSDIHLMRDKFDQEMKKMEDEMSRFRTALIDRESSPNQQSNLTSRQEEQAAKKGSGTWQGMISPLIQQDGDNKQLKLQFNVSQYKPDEIVVKTVDNKLLVHAKHEEKSDNGFSYREYKQEFMLPKNTNPELIKSSLSKDGVLTVESPLPAIAGKQEKIIPIAQS